mgnify:CR=1 FL=1
MKFILRWLGIAIATFVAIWLIPGIYPVGDNGYIAVAAFSLALALINSLVKPIAQFISFPLTVLTLGIFYIVVNALLLNLASWLSINVFPSGVFVASFGDAFIGAIVISIVSGIINAVTGANDDEKRAG